MLTIRRCEFVKPVILVATVTYFVVAVNNKQINSLYDSFIVNTTSGDTCAICKLASIKTRQIHHKALPVKGPLHVGVQFVVHREKCISIQSNPQRLPAYPVWNSVNSELDGYNG